MRTSGTNTSDVHTDEYIHMNTYIWIHTYEYIHMNTYIWMHTWIHTYEYIHMNTYEYMRTSGVNTRAVLDSSRKTTPEVTRASEARHGAFTYTIRWVMYHMSIVSTKVCSYIWIDMYSYVCKCIHMYEHTLVLNTWIHMHLRRDTHHSHTLSNESCMQWVMYWL